MIKIVYFANCTVDYSETCRQNRCDNAQLYLLLSQSRKSFGLNEKDKITACPVYEPKLSYIIRSQQIITLLL